MVHLFKPTSYTAGAALAVGATLAWKLVSFANALLIALYFGAGRTTDVYFYLLMVMGFGVTFLQRMNAAVIIPEAMAQEARAPGAGRPLLNSFLYFYILLLLLLGAAGFLAPVGLARLFSRFDAPQLTANQLLITLCFVLFGLQLLTAYLTAVLEMYRRFASALLTPLNALLPLFFLIGCGRTAGIISMVYGFLTANLVQIAVFGWMMKKELKWNFRPARVQWQKHLTQNLASNQLLELANIVSSVLPLYLLSGLSAGLVSALNYARQLSDSPTEIFTFRVANVSKIQLTEDASRQQWARLNRHFLSTQHFLLFVLTPLAVFTACFAPEIITLFFKRGNFSAADVQNAAAFLRPLMGVMWFLALISMQNNLIAAGRKVKESLPYVGSGLLLFILAVPFVMKHWGAWAFVYLQLLCCAIGLGINSFFFRKHMPQADFLRSLRNAGRLLALNLCALIPPGIYLDLRNPSSIWEILGAGGLLFVGSVWWLTSKSGDLQTAASFGKTDTPA